MNIEELLRAIARDLETSSERVGDEFPISKMSRGVAKASARLIAGVDALRSARAWGLDIGTGCGVHAIVMRHGGVGNVVAIDRSKPSLQRAADRARRLTDKRLKSDDGATLNSSIRFEYGDICHAHTLPVGPFDLITFNPPAFLKSGGAISDHPLERGLYEAMANSSEAEDPKQAMLIRFFNDVMPSRLKVNGFAVVTWPLLQRRIAFAPEDASTQRVSHPLKVLQAHTAWAFECDTDAPLPEVFHASAPLAGYGRTISLVNELRRPEVSRLMADSLIDRGPERMFRFAILTFQRTGEGTLRLSADAKTPRAAV